MDMGNEPNRLSDLYRNFTPAACPFQSEKHLDFVEVSEDGYMLLGTSNLTGRYWTGSVWYFMKAIAEKETCLTGVDCSTGVTDGKFLDRKQKVVIGEDSGAVTVLYIRDMEDDTYLFKPIATRNDHDNSVLSISVSTNKTKIVTGGMDMCIKVWNIDELVTEHTYRPAHCDLVTNVAFCPDSTDCIFASSSLDGSLLLWDVRQSNKPARVLLETPDEGLSAVAWQPGQENFLNVGTVLGNIKSLDIRTTNILAKTRPFSRPIHRLSSAYTSWLAVCADSNEVKVLDCRSENLDTLYSDCRHTDFVRGLSWHPQLQTLITCGWDKRILSHSINQ